MAGARSAAKQSGASKKRRRDEEESSSDEEPAQGTATTGAEASSDSDSSEEEDDDAESSDDETENALFRPANDDVAEQEDADSDDAKAEAVEEVKPKKDKKKKKKPVLEDEDSELAEERNAIEDELNKKTEATVYIEGIPYAADESDVVSHFAQCGAVKEVRMPRYQDSGKPRGYAHVVFESEAAVAKALKLDGKYLKGRYLTIKVAERPRLMEMALKEQKTVKTTKGCRTVFIKQLPYDVEEETIQTALSKCGTIVSIRLPQWNHTKNLKGFGYVEFSQEAEAVAAVKRSGMRIGDRMVIISLDTGSGPKASFRLRDGQYWSKQEEGKKALARKLSDKEQRQHKSGKKQRT